jgi:hypothetical protein
MAEILRDRAAQLVAIEKDGRTARGAQSMPESLPDRAFAGAREAGDPKHATWNFSGLLWADSEIFLTW